MFDTAAAINSNSTIEAYKQKDICDKIFVDAPYEADCFDVQYDTEGNTLHKPDIAYLMLNSMPPEELLDKVIGIQIT